MARRLTGLSENRPARPTLNLDTASTRKRNFEIPGITRHGHIEPETVDTDFKEIMNCTGNITIDGKVYKTDISDLEHLGELGNGTCGHVVKMLHKPSNQVIAVKQMRRSKDENKRIIMDLQVVLKSHDCPYIVNCLGCFITDSDVWICMELMATCMDKLLKKIKDPIPEYIIGKVAVATVKALHYLKETHEVIHRDVKPSNILLDEKGNVKLCDFGISGRLVDSKAKTRSAGCTAYMAPERIDPPDPNKPNYDIRADVWSFGITLVELATGKFPYEDCSTDFEVMSRILFDEPPKLPTNRNFSNEFRSFVEACLKKNYKDRPKYKDLLQHEFIKTNEVKHADMKTWYDVMCGSARKYQYSSSSSFPSLGRSSGRLRSSPTVGSTGSSVSSATTSPSPSSLRGSRYEDFRLPSPRSTARSAFDRLSSEPGPSLRSPSTPGTPSPIIGIPPDPPPRFNRFGSGSGSDGLRTPTLTTSSSSSSGNMISPSGMSVTNSSPSPPDPPPPPMRRLRTLLLCYSDSC
ncbi:unnamed protein product [Allacma fusca]|uniref:mitogen-activated protein kinase kinase n=1 Tax=Allacma fusca TaxID=39272 RepID=A0A8J2Q126_9HEXA|nr:unnamed protein product [Allacma fusca]